MPCKPDTTMLRSIFNLFMFSANLSARLRLAIKIKHH